MTEKADDFTHHVEDTANAVANAAIKMIRDIETNENKVAMLFGVGCRAGAELCVHTLYGAAPGQTRKEKNAKIKKVVLEAFEKSLDLSLEMRDTNYFEENSVAS